jgi:hypothetical protein
MWTYSPQGHSHRRLPDKTSPTSPCFNSLQRTPMRCDATGNYRPWPGDVQALAPTACVWSDNDLRCPSLPLYIMCVSSGFFFKNLFFGFSRVAIWFFFVFRPPRFEWLNEVETGRAIRNVPFVALHDAVHDSISGPSLTKNASQLNLPSPEEQINLEANRCISQNRT